MPHMVTFDGLKVSDVNPVAGDALPIDEVVVVRDPLDVRSPKLNPTQLSTGTNDGDSLLGYPGAGSDELTKRVKPGVLYGAQMGELRSDHIGAFRSLNFRRTNNRGEVFQPQDTDQKGSVIVGHSIVFNGADNFGLAMRGPLSAAQSEVDENPGQNRAPIVNLEDDVISAFNKGDQNIGVDASRLNQGEVVRNSVLPQVAFVIPTDGDDIGRGEFVGKANAYVDEDVDGFMKLGDIRGEIVSGDYSFIIYGGDGHNYLNRAEGFAATYDRTIAGLQAGAQANAGQPGFQARGGGASTFTPVANRNGTATVWTTGPVTSVADALTNVNQEGFTWEAASDILTNGGTSTFNTDQGLIIPTDGDDIVRGEFSSNQEIDLSEGDNATDTIPAFADQVVESFAPMDGMSSFGLSLDSNSEFGASTAVSGSVIDPGGSPSMTQVSLAEGLAI